MSDERRLAFIDRRTNYLTSEIASDTAGDSVFNELQLPTTGKGHLALTLSADEWTQLFNVVMTGADLVYPEEAHEIVWLLWKAGKLETFCEAVADCILTSGDVQDAILKVVVAQGNGSDPDNQIPDGQQTENWIDVTCDEDVLFGACVEVVNGVMDATLDVLQKICSASEE